MNQKQKHKLGLLTALLFSISIVSCSTERAPCLEPTLAKLNVRCLQWKNNTWVDTLLPNTNFYTLDIDSATHWYWAAKSQTQFALVLNPNKDTCKWILQVDSAQAIFDTLQFVYEKQLHFYSNACGYSYNYILKTVNSTKHQLDSFKLLSNQVNTKANNENIHLYF